MALDSPDMEQLIPQLVNALQIVMDSASPHELRVTANNFIDGFKESSPYCVECGFHLILYESAPIVRHFGLVLIEHCIKYQWNSMDLTKKVYIKDNLMLLIASGTKNLLEESYYIKNGLAKNVVEIIKREWPQQWAGLLEELYRLSAMGDTQAELVLIIFLVLAEDVVILNNAQSQRRREIYQCLVSNLDQLFPFFTELLMSNAGQYLILKKNGDDASELAAKVHCQVATSALETMAEYIDWIPVSHLIAKNGILLQMICELLVDDKLKYPAVKCLLVVTTRKGKPTDRVPLLGLFDQVCLERIFKATSLAEESSLQEPNYSFLKNVCQAVFSLGSVLHSLYGFIANLELPTTFSTYLEVILELTSHSSLVISSQAVLLWNNFLQHNLISKNLKFLSCIPRLVPRVAPKLMKVGFPSRNDSLSSSFSKLDFDCDEDFSASFAKLRTECVTLLKLATVLAPDITFSYTSQWLQEQLKKPINISPDTKQCDSHCTSRSPSFLEWDALSVCLESVISKTSVGDSIIQTLTDEGIHLMNLLLSYRSEDPLILSSWLSCISALFPFVKHSATTLQSILDAIFRIVVFSAPGQSKRTRSKAVKNVRRHACSCLVKLCKLYPALFEPFFDQIYQYVKDLSTDAEQLSQLEKCTLIEALILIKNQCKNYEKQSLFLQDILSPIASVWLSEDMKLALSSVTNFMTYVGLDRSPVKPSPQDIYGIHRSRIIGCLDIILAVIKRSGWPDEIEMARSGGFIERTTDSGTVIFRNPAQEFLFPLYPHVFHLLRILNDLWLPVNQQVMNSDYASINEMTETDKNNLLGITISNLNINDVPAAKDPIERFKIFITGVYDTCHQIIGQSGISLGPNFYSVPNLVNYLLFSVCSQIDPVPEHRLRSLVRYLMKPLIQHCPADYYQSVAIPLLSVFCSHMDQKFHKIWSKYSERRIDNSEMENDHAEAQEVIEEQLFRNMTREYLEFLTGVLMNKASNVKSTEVMEDDEMAPVFVSSESKLSELGQLIFSHKEFYPSIVLCIFDVLVWIDNTSCVKSLQLCLPVIRQLVDDKNLGMEEARYLFRCLLLGLQKHGQHDFNNHLISMGYQAYEIMRPIHPSISSMILEISEGSEANLKSFDDILLCQNRSKSVSEKKKKELFKSLVIGIVEKSVGEIFSRKAVIKNLPPTFRQPKPKVPLLDASGLKDMGLCTLFGSAT